MATTKGYKIGKLPPEQVFRGQAKLILDKMSTTEAKTTSSIADAIKSELVTRQNPERVVAFYMSVWKKKGWVTSGDVTVSAGEAAESEAAEAAPHSVQEEVGGLDADTHAAARDEANAASAASFTPDAFPDMKGRKLSEAVLEVLAYNDKSMDVEEIVKFLASKGYDFRENQVSSAVQNLLRQEKLVRDGEKFRSAA